MDILKHKNLELLAPAGSVESFFAAVENGADAVFCGLEQFSARAKAKNFSLQDLELIVGYASERGVKVYVALNTLLQEKELPAIIELLETLEYLQIDGIIIQDLGLYHIAHKYFPKIPLHASTQLLTHNLAGVLMLERMGFSRVVLARELTLREISAIHSKSNIEIEHFIHGAMCYSMSGHCLFSSYVDGRSGNRGRCAQPCRRRYHHDGTAGFHFSTSDFSSIELIPELIQAGVCSFKIEGRMKSAEYIASVVASYRMVIDATPSDRNNAVKTANETLKQAMGRSASHGFLKGTSNKNLVLAKQKGGLGKIIGKVQRIKKNEISFTTNDLLHVGDRLRIQPGNDRAGVGFTVRALKQNNKSVKRAAKNSFVTIQLAKIIRVGSGDLIFKLSTGKSFTTSEEACRRRLSKAPLRNHPVQLTIECAGSEIVVAADIEDLHFAKKYQVEMFPAERSPLTVDTLEKVFSKIGNPVLSLATLNAPDLPPVVIKPSRLKQIRRDFYKLLFDQFLVSQKQKRGERIAKIKDSVKTSCLPIEKYQKTEKLFVFSDNPDDLDLIQEYTEITFAFPLTQKLLASALKKKIPQERIIWDLPSVIFDKEWPVLQENVTKAIGSSYAQFRLNSLSHFKLFEPTENVKLYGGAWLYSLNSQAIIATARQKTVKWSFSIEDDKLNIEQLLKGKEQNNLLLTVYSPVDLFTSRIKPAISEQNFILTNDKGGLLSLKQNDEMTVTQAEKQFSLIGKLQVLRKMGCVNFVLDLRGSGLLSERGQEVLQAYYEDRSVAGTTQFNFERGLR